MHVIAFRNNPFAYSWGLYEIFRLDYFSDKRIMIIIQALLKSYLQIKG